jgi:primosomal protein N' (replication factor Y)
VFNTLTCHYWNSEPNSANVPGCKTPGLNTKGFGTEKIEGEIRLIFPDAVWPVWILTHAVEKSYEK